ncbi:GlsB/YeaQ/YmgE family stress response membrane protein [Spirosoma sp. SC4-14]|uniref:GlsB/YeaQ/YmgE family stress response membrane protein n=1 Tax=Spirosoma sp. SC4-14 TaxID=3128900 RepID=UPI0030D2AE16
MSFLISILIGALAGWLADQLFPRFSFSIWMQILLGIAGGFVGGWLFGNDFQQMLGLPDLLARTLTALIGAIIILAIAGLIKRMNS